MTNWCFAVQILIAQEVWSTATEIASPQGKVIKDKVTIIWLLYNLDFHAKLLIENKISKPQEEKVPFDSSESFKKPIFESACPEFVRHKIVILMDLQFRMSTMKSKLFWNQISA